MRRILLTVMSTLATVVLLFGYRTSTPSPVLSSATVDGNTGSATGDGTSSTVPAAPGSPTSGGSAGTQMVTGAAVQTRWGPVQVQVTVDGGAITAVDTVQVPSSNQRDVEINDRAVPVLTQEALQAQSADIDSVSGATYTSQGYIGSLQSALDQAGL